MRDVNKLREETEKNRAAFLKGFKKRCIDLIEDKINDASSKGIYSVTVHAEDLMFSNSREINKDILKVVVEHYSAQGFNAEMNRTDLIIDWSE